MIMKSKTNTNQIQTYKTYDPPVDLSESASICAFQHLLHHAALLIQIVDRIRKQNCLELSLVSRPGTRLVWIRNLKGHLETLRIRYSDVLRGNPGTRGFVPLLLSKGRAVDLMVQKSSRFIS